MNSQQCEGWQTRSGCPANDNFFDSQADCEDTCAGPRPCKVEEDCKGLTDDPRCGTTCSNNECLICALPAPPRSISVPRFCVTTENLK